MENNTNTAIPGTAKVSEPNPTDVHSSNNSEVAKVSEPADIQALEHHDDEKEPPQILTLELARKIMGLPPEPPQDHHTNDRRDRVAVVEGYHVKNAL